MTLKFDDYEAAIEAFKKTKSKNIVVLTGAGISVPSGIPDFRSAGGVWTRFPVGEYGTIDVFKKKPDKFWELNHELLSKDLMGAKPNDAHYALAELEELGYKVTIVTQNVDGLHQEAGSSNVIEIHGSGKNLVCLKCKWKIPTNNYELIKGIVPLCKECDYPLKPDMVYFGEDVRGLRKGKRAAFMAGLCIIAGTSGEVAPANTIPQHARKAIICEFNINVSSLTQIADFLFRGSVETTLPAFVDLLN